MKRITIADVAEALGVSKTTVSRAISGKGRIGEDTRQRVLNYIEEHDYTPNVIAKGLAKQKTYNIGVMMPMGCDVMDLPFFQNCLYGIQTEAAKKNYDLLLTMCEEDDTKQLERVVTNRKVDGVILMRTFVEDKQVKMLEEKQIPFATIGTSHSASGIQVDQDHQTACKELTGLLLKKGMRKIALLGGDKKYVVTGQRLNGFLEAYEEAGQKAEWIYLDMDAHRIPDEAVNQLLLSEVDCIICMDDAICSGLLRVLRNLHRKVPQDICVASFYNSTVLANHSPSITSLAFDEKELGMVACRSLLDQVEERTTSHHTVLGYDIVWGDSTDF